MDEKIEILKKQIDSVVKRFSKNSKRWRIIRKELIEEMQSTKELIRLIDIEINKNQKQRIEEIITKEIEISKLN